MGLLRFEAMVKVLNAKFEMELCNCAYDCKTWLGMHTSGFEISLVNSRHRPR
jgi:hypothetical protein